MKVGVVFPQTESSSDPGALRAYVETAEALGYDHVALYDHVLGASPERPGGWRGPYTDKHPFHEVLVTLGYFAAVTSRLELATEVLVLPQRQSILVAKQAAQVDLLSRGRLRLGVGLGWNRVELEALGEEFGNRGRRIEEQVEVMRLLWREPLVSFQGEFHNISLAGINPLPGRAIPVWMGGTAEPAKRRLARIADGWMMNTGLEKDPHGALAHVRELVSEAGRDPRAFGVEVPVHISEGVEHAAAELDEWRAEGISHASLNSMRAGLEWPRGHLEALERFAGVLAGA